ncbi:hypothetical protein D3C73_640520 [compost metagenome]
MSSKLIWQISLLARQIWFRATLFCIAAIATALMAILISPYLPANLSTRIGADSVDRILGIIASSMLTVTTFSLSTMVSAFSAATSNVTPRATRLVMEDSTTQNVLATFIGSFMFSLVGIIALTTGAYGEQGRVVLFVVTIGVIALIVITLLRWIDHLSRLGRVTETTRRVEQATIDAIEKWQAAPNLGGKALPKDTSPPKDSGRLVQSDKVGYVQHVDSGALAAIADDIAMGMFISAIPGTVVGPGRTVAWTAKVIDDEVRAKILECFAIDDTRSFDQDPRFGASVLTEIASRALSPAVNDPGTAIDVLSRTLRVLVAWRDAAGGQEGKVLYPALHVASIDVSDLFDDLYTPIARDGAGLVEVGLRLQKTLALAADLGPEYRRHAKRHSQEALDRADKALHIDVDRKRLKDVSLSPKS